MKISRNLFLRLFLPLAVLLTGGATLYANLEIENMLAHLNNREAVAVRAGKEALSSQIESITRDLVFLSRQRTLLNALNRQTPENLAKLAEDFAIFCEAKGIFDQVRWIDETGKEVVRVNHIRGKAVVVRSGQLQNKHARYYFRDSFRLNPGEIYVSPLDLNIEQQDIELPYKPVIHLATPLVNAHGYKRGIIILNYHGKNILQDFAEATANIADHVMLLNKDGYWLKSPNPADDWGFMLNRPDLSLAVRSPEAWMHIAGTDSGSITLDDGMWTWETDNPLTAAQTSSEGKDDASDLAAKIDDGKYKWKSVSHLSAETMNTIRLAVWLKVAGIASLLLGLFGWRSWQLAQAWAALTASKIAAENTNRELFSAQSELAATLDALPDLLFKFDLDGRYLDCHASRPELLAAPPEMLIGKTVRDILPPQAAEIVMLALQEANATGTSHGKQIRLQVPRGLLWFELSVARKPAAPGLLPRFILLSHDITRRKAAEQAVWQQKHFLREVIDTDPNLISVKDATGRFLLVNQAMAKKLGKAPQELIGRRPESLKNGKEELSHYLEADREVLTTLRPIAFTSQYLQDNAPCWLQVIKTPMLQPDGTAHVLSIAMDITDRKRAEEKLAISYAQLRTLSQRLEIVREEEKQHIARELHDELGGILSGLNVHIYLLKSEIPADNAETQSQLNMLAKLVDKGLQSLHRTVSELRPLMLDELGFTLAVTAYVKEFEKNAKIGCQLRMPGIEPQLDEVQATAIFRIIQEALTNVAKHARASTVNIMLRNWQNMLAISVRDNGMGFKMNKREKNSFGLIGITERAFMLEGKARINSQPGKGTTVLAVLPLTANRNARRQAGQCQAPPAMDK